jgi:16S rRNA (cytosine1402-N4)-methyltransferase
VDRAGTEEYLPPPPGAHPISGGHVHVTVLAEVAVAALDPRPGGVYVDGTFGAGGHARLIAERIRLDGRLLCIDRDPASRVYFERLLAGHGDSTEFIVGSYARIADFLAHRRIDGADGILLDLGISSLQLDDPERGFSFRFDGPLDMRFDPGTGRSAAELLEVQPEDEIARILREYGEERQARRIARAIVRRRGERPFATTGDLAAVVESAVGGRKGERLHPATRTFQALRIAVNDELGEVERGVSAGIDALAVGGRMVVISFHSLEDRIVKRAFADAARGCICPRDVPVCICGRVPRLRLIGRAARASDAEIARNPRARSAVMRVAERIAVA